MAYNKCVDLGTYAIAIAYEWVDSFYNSEVNPLTLQEQYNHQRVFDHVREQIDSCNYHIPRGNMITSQWFQDQVRFLSVLTEKTSVGIHGDFLQTGVARCSCLGE